MLILYCCFWVRKIERKHSSSVWCVEVHLGCCSHYSICFALIPTTFHYRLAFKTFQSKKLTFSPIFYFEPENKNKLTKSSPRYLCVPCLSSAWRCTPCTPGRTTWTLLSLRMTDNFLSCPGSWSCHDISNVLVLHINQKWAREIQTQKWSVYRLTGERRKDRGFGPSVWLTAQSCKRYI